METANNEAQKIAESQPQTGPNAEQSPDEVAAIRANELTDQYRALSGEEKTHFPELQKAAAAKLQHFFEGRSSFATQNPDEAALLEKIRVNYLHGKEAGQQDFDFQEGLSNTERVVYSNLINNSSFEILADRRAKQRATADLEKANSIRKNLGIPEKSGGKEKLFEEQIIPPQYQGLTAEALEIIWTVPEYIEPDKTEQEEARKQRAVEYLRKKEQGQQTMDAPRGEVVTDKSELFGWNASYELAKIAESEGIDLASLSREEYADYAISKDLKIDDSQLRAQPWQRLAKSAAEVLAGNKERRARINPEVDKAFGNFCYEIRNRADEGDVELEEGIRIRTGTSRSNSWLFFKINNGKVDGDDSPYKSYVSVRDLNGLTPDNFKNYMQALRDGGYNGDVKIFQDMEIQGVALNDQIVMHGASEADADLALKIAASYFGNNLGSEGKGQDGVVDGERMSYSQILAKHIKDTIDSKTSS